MTSDPALLRAILKVRDGIGGGCWWVECGACEAGWQVAPTPRASGEDASTLTHGRASDHLRPEASTTIL